MKKYTTPTVSYTAIEMQDILTISTDADGNIKEISFADLIKSGEEL